MTVFDAIGIGLFTILGVFALAGLVWAFFMGITRRKWMSKTLLDVFELEIKKSQKTVYFYCWGQNCQTTFPDLDKALAWCVVCVDKGFLDPYQISDGEGNVVYEHDDLTQYIRERL